MNTTIVERGDIWATDLRPAIGVKIVKKRPALVISTDGLNKSTHTVIILPITSQKYTVLGPERIALSKRDAAFLRKNSVILVYQIRAVDKQRLYKKIGTLSKEKLQEVERSLLLVLDLL